MGTTSCLTDGRFVQRDLLVMTRSRKVLVSGDGENLSLRMVEGRDVEHLWTMLRYASHFGEQAGNESADIRANTELMHYVAGWGRRVISRRGREGGSGDRCGLLDCRESTD